MKCTISPPERSRIRRRRSLSGPTHASMALHTVWQSSATVTATLVIFPGIRLMALITTSPRATSGTSISMIPATTPGIVMERITGVRSRPVNRLFSTSSTKHVTRSPCSICSVCNCSWAGITPAAPPSMSTIHAPSSERNRTVPSHTVPTFSTKSSVALRATPFFISSLKYPISGRMRFWRRMLKLKNLVSSYSRSTEPERPMTCTNTANRPRATSMSTLTSTRRRASFCKMVNALPRMSLYDFSTARAMASKCNAVSASYPFFSLANWRNPLTTATRLAKSSLLKLSLANRSAGYRASISLKYAVDASISSPSTSLRSHSEPHSSPTSSSASRPQPPAVARLVS
mmetsp:Transcript_6916/g.23096  ORF Transcript_6916/g.23096 Transcript_6916/m.23096 type:complete len:345 (-) Transcript_6916:502-1536(-)